MTGTHDILAVFQTGLTMSLSAEDLDHVNEWIQDNKNQLRLVHFGRTAINYRGGEIAGTYQCTREQVRDQI